MIFDTSSLINLLTEGKIDPLLEEKILDLTLYETSNVLWKMHHIQEKINKKELHELLQLLNRLEKEMQVHSPERTETMKIASEHGITFYDASYLSAAKNSETLITEDTALRKTAEKEEIKTLNATELLE
ncbi:MAG: type II toxin-antitoxin system VapC family toxin [Candidatus Nanohaloarchaea archaeon]